MELNDMERLFVGQALFKRLGEQMSTKDPDSLRGREDQLLAARYAASGAKSYDAVLLGRKVGTYSVKVSKQTPKATETVFSVQSTPAATEWARQNPGEVADYVQDHLEDFLRYCWERYGEIPDGCTVTEVDVPARPGRVTGTTLKVDPHEVSIALRDGLPGSGPIVGLLEAGE